MPTFYLGEIYFRLTIKSLYFEFVFQSEFKFCNVSFDPSEALVPSICIYLKLVMIHFQLTKRINSVKKDRAVEVR